MALSKCPYCNGTGELNVPTELSCRSLCYYCGSPNIVYLSEDKLWMCLNEDCNHFKVSVLHCSRHSLKGGFNG